MGELTLGACGVSHRRPLRRHEGRQDADQTPRGALRRKIGEEIFTCKASTANLHMLASDPISLQKIVMLPAQYSPARILLSLMVPSLE
jgi:hypothetical protein